MQKEQYDDFTDQERQEILKQEFPFGNSDKNKKQELSKIIDWIINDIKSQQDIKTCLVIIYHFNQNLDY